MSNLLQLLGDGLFVFAAVGWALEWRQRKVEVREVAEDAYDEGWHDCDRRRMAEWMARQETDHDTLASVMLEESAGPPELAGHTVYPQLAPEALAAEDVPRVEASETPSGFPGEGVGPQFDAAARPPLDGLGHPYEPGDDTLTRTYIAQGGWERDQRSIAATGQSLWFLAWQQRQAAA